jgi:hypothetical protein
VRLLLAVLLPALALTAADERVAESSGIKVTYDAADFSAHSWKQEPRLTTQEIGTDIPEGVGPAHAVLLLTAVNGTRRDPQDSRIAFIPLSDTSVPNFAKAYPGLQSSAAALRALIAARGIPNKRQLNAADPELVDSEYSFCTRIERIETPAVNGFAYLAQFTQEIHPDPPDNRQLTYVFLGVTAGGRYLVESNLAVSRPALPKAPGQLAGLDGATFQPSLTRLNALIRSISVR